MGWPFSLLLNRLLDSDAAARSRLAPFAGQAVELRAPPLPSLRFVILPGGRVEAADAAPDLVVTLPPQALAALPNGEAHVLRTLQVEGDVQLAAAVMALARELRWDPEEQLSHVVGDVAAHRLGRLARAFAAWPAEAVRRLAESTADYAAEEKRLLVKRGEAQSFAREVTHLRDAVERLEKRVRNLE